MKSAGTYAAVAIAREKETVVRLFLGAFIAVAAMVLRPSPWPMIWLCALLAYQLCDRMLTQWVIACAERGEISRGARTALLVSVFGSSTMFALITPYMWFEGGEAGRMFAVMAWCASMLHVALRSYQWRAMLITGAAPHALCLFVLPATYLLAGAEADPMAVGIVIIGASLYIAHLAFGAQQSNLAVAALRKATTEAYEAREMAERASAAKSQFLATVSHEIRTPMNAVLSAAHLLKRTSLTSEQESHVAMLTNGGEILVALLNDVLDISKIEAGKMELDEADLNLDDALDALVALYGARAQDNGVRLVLEKSDDLPGAIRTDPLRLRQILFNLLSNAVKFTDDGAVTIRAQRHSAGAADWVSFEVQDTGCGIDAEALTRLFGNFEQASSATARNHGGTGLGLAISRKLAQMMGGDITCESTLGEGSIFRLELPYVEAANASALNVGAANDEVFLDRPLSILVADDHDVNRRILSLFLEPLGWSLTMAINGADAVEAAQTEVFDAILMDMQMPVMDGVAASVAIRGGGPNASTPIIALTANALCHHRDAWAPVGVAAFLTKPIDPELLVETLLAVSAPSQPCEERAIA